jgi:hypothetical protein
VIAARLNAEQVAYIQDLAVSAGCTISNILQFSLERLGGPAALHVSDHVRNILLSAAVGK